MINFEAHIARPIYRKLHNSGIPHDQSISMDGWEMEKMSKPREC